MHVSKSSSTTTPKLGQSSPTIRPLQQNHHKRSVSPHSPQLNADIAIDLLSWFSRWQITRNAILFVQQRVFLGLTGKWFVLVRRVSYKHPGFKLQELTYIEECIRRCKCFRSGLPRREALLLLPNTNFRMSWLTRLLHRQHV